jgi:hypothetical protein
MCVDQSGNKRSSRKVNRLISFGNNHFPGRPDGLDPLATHDNHPVGVGLGCYTVVNARWPQYDDMLLG